MSGFQRCLEDHFFDNQGEIVSNSLAFPSFDIKYVISLVLSDFLDNMEPYLSN